MATAWAEYQQGIGTRIGTLAPYELVVETMADLTDPDVLRPLMMNVEDLRGDWRSARIRGETPMTWNVVEMLIANGVDAIRVPSVVFPGGVNVVVFGLDGRSGCRVRVVDPENALPVDQASWPPVTGPT